MTRGRWARGCAIAIGNSENQCRGAAKPARQAAVRRYSENSTFTHVFGCLYVDKLDADPAPCGRTQTEKQADTSHTVTLTRSRPAEATGRTSIFKILPFVYKSNIVHQVVNY